MGKTLAEISQQLKDANKKVQLIYAFNGTGKTRLSREFKHLIAPKSNGEGTETIELPRNKILYYNAFTEDLFYWDNDLEMDAEHKLLIQENSYTDWLLALLKDLGQDGNIVKYFQRYTSDKLTPHFSEDFAEVRFSLERGNNERSDYIKLSKGEESIFIWSVFYSLLDQVVAVLNVPEASERESRQFDQLEYVFIDDPVSSLDDNHLIELAVNLAGLIKSSQSDLKFIITTHSPLFYNVLFNELNGKICYMLERFDDGSFNLSEKAGDSNKNFSYHLHIKQVVEQAITESKVERYHFTLLRNLYEKTASYLGYPKWSDLLPDDKQLYLTRVINFTSHSTLANEAVKDPTPAEKAMVGLLLNHLKITHKFWQQQGA